MYVKLSWRPEVDENWADQGGPPWEIAYYGAKMGCQDRDGYSG